MIKRDRLRVVTRLFLNQGWRRHCTSKHSSAMPLNGHFWIAVFSLVKIISTMENRSTVLPFHLAITITNFTAAHLLLQQLTKLTQKIPAFMLLYVKSFKPCLWAVWVWLTGWKCCQHATKLNRWLGLCCYLQSTSTYISIASFPALNLNYSTLSAPCWVLCDKHSSLPLPALQRQAFQSLLGLSDPADRHYLPSTVSHPRWFDFSPISPWEPHSMCYKAVWKHWITVCITHFNNCIYHQ